MYKIVLTFLAVWTFVFSVNAQQVSEDSRNGALVESESSPSSQEIIFTPDSASMYIIELLHRDRLWKTGSDSAIMPLARLIDHYYKTYDSIESALSKTNYNMVKFREVVTLQNDTLPLRWLNDTSFIVDTMKLGRDPLFVQKTIVQKITDSLVLIKDSTLIAQYAGDSIVRIRDTIISESESVLEVIIDTVLLESNNLQLYQIKNKKIVPRILPLGGDKTYHFLADGSKLVISKPVPVIVAGPDSPFNILPNKKVPDSLQVAVQTLLSYINQRDSIPVYLNNVEGKPTPFWLTVGEDDLQRYWVKNRKNDSVSLWMGNPDKSNITLILEDDINIERIEKETVDDVPFTMATPNIELAKVEPLNEIPVFWDFDFASSFSLSQNHLSNWAKGGENSLSSVLDIKGEAKYTNKEAKTEWKSNGRLKYGSVVTDDYGLRKNTDILEFDSKYNKAIRNKIDFSALYHMKSQIAKGYKYPTDTTEVLVSKFLNPATFTVGVGVEYKPFKKSTINFSVLSYKNTFVLDTANIPQTNHGIDEDKRSKQEMGGQVLIKSEMTLLDDLKINNSIRLFSNYLEKPENIDVEWEIDLEKQISLYFTILLNIHMIYDDDIHTPVLGKNKKPVLLSDGETPKKAPQLQFKEFLGLTFLIKL